MWLRVATDALARYAAGGAAVEVSQDDEALVIRLPVVLNDTRLAPAFVSLYAPAPTAAP